MAFSHNLQFLRSRAGTTQEELAEQLDVSRQSVSKWESGASFPEMDTLLRLCDLYNVSLDTLLRGSVEESDVADTARYDAFMDRFTRRVAGAVAAILAAVGLLCMLDGAPVSELLTTAGFLLVVTVSTVVLVAGGIEYDHFRKKHPVIADFYTEEERERFHRTFVWCIAGGVGAILFGVVLMLLFFHFFPEQYPYESLASGFFLWIVAGAVYAFIYAGMQDEKYKISRYNRDNAPTPEVRRRQNLIGTVCAVLMLAATALYVALGFTRNAWGTVWWLFPVGAVLCGMVSVVLDPHKGEDD